MGAGFEKRMAASYAPLHCQGSSKFGISVRRHPPLQGSLSIRAAQGRPRARHSFLVPGRLPEDGAAGVCSISVVVPQGYDFVQTEAAPCGWSIAIRNEDKPWIMPFTEEAIECATFLNNANVLAVVRDSSPLLSSHREPKASDIPRRITASTASP